MEKKIVKHNDGYQTITFSGNRVEVATACATYMRHYPAEKYGTCRISRFEKPDGSLEIQLYRSTEKFL